MSTNRIIATARDTYDPSGDKWGWAMAWMFALCDYIEFRTNGSVPAEWEYQPSPFGADTDSWEYEGIAELQPSATELYQAGAILSRYLDACEVAGLDY